MKKGSVDKHALKSQTQARETYLAEKVGFDQVQASRHEVLKAIQAVSKEDDVLLATTGFMGRELYACEDRPNQLYMVGSMGCISSLGLGLALAQPQRRVIVIDGDGAMLMRMGALATVGYERPANLIHVLLDNEQHESTGGQSTVAHSVDFAGVAAACGYARVARTTGVEQVQDFIREGGSGLSFLHMKIKPGVPDDLPRPSVTPAQVSARLQQFIKNTA